MSKQGKALAVDKSKQSTAGIIVPNAFTLIELLLVIAGIGIVVFSGADSFTLFGIVCLLPR